MKHQWLAYVIVGLLSIGAGVAIAGLPNNVPVDATIIPPTTTEAPESTVATPTTPETTVPATTTVPTTASTTTVLTTTAPADSSPETTDSVPDELPDRSELNVVVANGANVSGAASRIAAQLEELGYVDVALRNGTNIVDFSVVYYAEGFEESALRLAADLDLLPDFVAPIDDSPSVPDIPADVELLVYVGLDRA